MSASPADRWQQWVASGAHESLPFAEQWELFQKFFAGSGDGAGPPIVWRPDEARRDHSNLALFLRQLGLADYEALHAWSVAEREAFWAAAIERLGIVMERPFSTILDLSEGVEHARWLDGARLNIVDSCFASQPSSPRPKSGAGERECQTSPRAAGSPAVVWCREGSTELHSIDYQTLERRVDDYSRVFVAAGLVPRDRLGFYLPLTVDCVAAYLGAVRAGLEVVSIASSFAAPEVERRLAIGRCAALVTVASFVRAGKRHSPFAVAVAAGAPKAIVLAGDDDAPTTLRQGDLLAADLVATNLAVGDLLGQGVSSRDIGPPDRVTNVLFSSGTTGDPKAIPWTHLQPIKCAMDGHFHHDIQPGDVVAWPTDIGWMMGPWLIYAGLVNGATIALYEGAPTGAEFARFVEEAGVTMLGVVPSLVRAWRRSGAADGADWSGVRLFSSTGEASTVEDYLWLMSRAGYRAPVIEYCGGTEIGGGYVTGSVLQPASPATFTTPALGLDFVILDDESRPVADDEAGEVFLVPPSIGLSQTLLNADHDEVYHAGCPPGPNGEALRRHGDRMRRLAGGFVQAEGRADDTMNLGGVKVSSLEIEREAARHPAVRECAAISVPGPEGGPHELVIFAVVSAQVEAAQVEAAQMEAAQIEPESLRRELNELIAASLNPLFKVAQLKFVESLPRTASNKVMRRTLRAGLLSSRGGVR